VIAMERGSIEPAVRLGRRSHFAEFDDVFGHETFSALRRIVGILPRPKGQVCGWKSMLSYVIRMIDKI